MGLGSSLKGILPEEGGEILSNHVPEGLAVGSMIQTPAKHLGQGQQAFLKCGAGIEAKDKRLLLNHSSSPDKYLSALK